MGEYLPDLTFDDVRNNHNIDLSEEYHFTGKSLLSIRNTIINRCENAHNYIINNIDN